MLEQPISRAQEMDTYGQKATILDQAWDGRVKLTFGSEQFDDDFSTKRKSTARLGPKFGVWVDLSNRSYDVWASSVWMRAIPNIKFLIMFCV